MSHRGHVNKSGFPLQLALANKVTLEALGWRVFYKEHEWESDTNTGFLDLVLENDHKNWLMNIECKRVRDTDWIFLMDRQASETRQVAKLWASHRESESVVDFFDWLDIPMDPASPQSEFCVIPGQDNRSRPMLERTAANVVESTEALAREESLTLTYNYSNLRIYQNVIVTTATLRTCLLDIDEIDIATGEVPEDSEFKEVPYIRFRKQVGASISADVRAQCDHDIQSYLSNKESTVFVVNSRQFLNFLNNCELPNVIERRLQRAR